MSKISRNFGIVSPGRVTFIFIFLQPAKYLYMTKKTLHINNPMPQHTTKSFTTTSLVIHHYKCPSTIHLPFSVVHSPLNHSASMIYFTHIPRILNKRVLNQQFKLITYLPIIVKWLSPHGGLMLIHPSFYEWPRSASKRLIQIFCIL